MEKLAAIAALFYLAVIMSVGYTFFSFVVWVITSLGGICIGCEG
jgi:hypothetical protein